MGGFAMPTVEQSNAVIAFLALIVAALSVYFTYNGLKLQKRHNALSIIPVPFIALADYENLIRVKIRNDGIGPLIVKKLTFETDGAEGLHEDLVEYCPPMPSGLSWSNFSSGFVRSVRPGDELILIEVEIDEAVSVQANYRDQLRSVLSDITLIVEFTDVYGGKFLPATRKMDFFARRLSSSKKKNK